MTNGNNGILLISTKQDKSEMIKTGGIVMPSPRVNQTRVKTETKHIVCCDSITGDAFLIGEIDRVIWVDNNCVIKIKSYASLEKSRVWQDYGNGYSFAYISHPTKMQLRPGRYDFQPIYQNGKGRDTKAAASSTPAPEKKVSDDKYSAKQDTKLSRIEELRKELAELEANRKATLHQMIDALPDSQLDQVMDWLNMFTSK